jgi:hypothetical protein
MTKKQKIKLINKTGDALIKQVRQNLGIRALTKDEKANLMSDFTTIIYSYTVLLQEGEQK